MTIRDRVTALGKKARRHLPRRCHLLCVGAAKTGTTTIGDAFASALHCAHEPEAALTVRLVIDHLEGRLEDDALLSLLRERDRRLRLEVEASHPLGYLAAPLARAFPKARFLVTVREPHDWIRSRLKFHIQTDPPRWREYRDYFWMSRAGEHPPEETALKQLGLCPLDVYLAQYSDHYQRLVRELPADRTMWLRTDQIDGSLGDVARFAGIRPPAAPAMRRNTSKLPDEILAGLDRDYLAARVEHHCGWIREKWFT